MAESQSKEAREKEDALIKQINAKKRALVRKYGPSIKEKWARKDHL